MIRNSEGERRTSAPEPANGLHVHGMVVSLEPLPQEGGKPVVQLELDYFQRRSGTTDNLKRKARISFFYPNFSPGKIGPGDVVWADLEFISSWQELSLTRNREKWIKPLFAESSNYEYSTAGELFLHPESARERTLYLDVGFPISLTLGRPPYHERPKGLIRSGLFVQVSRGELFGYLSTGDAATLTPP